MITQEEIQDLFLYKDGKLYWKESRCCNKIKAGSESGAINAGGYRQVKINYKLYTTHRLVFLLFNGYLPDTIDHINGNKLDNRIENLRECSVQQNTFNSKKSLSNTSGIKGVTWCNGRNKYKAQIQLNGKTHFFGYYDDKFEAEKIVIEKRKLLHKQFARDK